MQERNVNPRDENLNEHFKQFKHFTEISSYNVLTNSKIILLFTCTGFKTVWNTNVYRIFMRRQGNFSVDAHEKRFEGKNQY